MDTWQDNQPANHYFSKTCVFSLAFSLEAFAFCTRALCFHLEITERVGWALNSKSLAVLCLTLYISFCFLVCPSALHRNETEMDRGGESSSGRVLCQDYITYACRLSRLGSHFVV